MLFLKLKKPGFYAHKETRFYQNFIYNSKSRQNKKKSKHHFVDIVIK